jgi:hypothetical protein
MSALMFDQILSELQGELPNSAQSCGVGEGGGRIHDTFGRFFGEYPNNNLIK